MNYAKFLATLLRITGTAEILAFGAVVMPREWMAHYHAALGLGEFPALGITDFMIRQASYTYGMHGIILWVLSFDIARYRPLLILTGISYVLAGPVFVWIDVSAGMPRFWMLGDGGSCFAIGLAILFLLSKAQCVPPISPDAG